MFQSPKLSIEILSFNLLLILVLEFLFPLYIGTYKTIYKHGLNSFNIVDLPKLTSDFSGLNTCFG